MLPRQVLSTTKPTQMPPTNIGYVQIDSDYTLTIAGEGTVRISKGDCFYLLEEEKYIHLISDDPFSVVEDRDGNRRTIPAKLLVKISEMPSFAADAV